MKVIIAGSRSFHDYPRLKSHMDALAASINIEEVICGGANGADILGKKWAIERNIPVKMFPADWDSYGKAAGIIRNTEMGNYADYLVAFWDKKSTGTAHMIQYMQSKGKHGEVEYF